MLKNLLSAAVVIGALRVNYFVESVLQHFASPKSDEWSRFVHTLQELRQHAAEREEDSILAGISSPSR